MLFLKKLTFFNQKKTNLYHFEFYYLSKFSAILLHQNSFCQEFYLTFQLSIMIKKSILFHFDGYF